MEEDFVFTDLLNGNSKNSYFIESNRKRTCFLLIHSKETLKSYISSSQIGEGAYFSLIFCRKTENFHSLLNQINNKTIFLPI